MRSGSIINPSKSLNPTVVAVIVFVGILTFLSVTLILSLQPLHPLVVKAILKYIWMFLGISVLFILIINQLLNTKEADSEDDDI